MPRPCLKSLLWASKANKVELMSCHWEELHLTASPLKFFKELSSLLALSKFPPSYIFPVRVHMAYTLSPSLLAAMMYYYSTLSHTPLICKLCWIWNSSSQPSYDSVELLSPILFSPALKHALSFFFSKCTPPVPVIGKTWVDIIRVIFLPICCMYNLRYQISKYEHWF